MYINVNDPQTGETIIHNQDEYIQERIDVSAKGIEQADNDKDRAFWADNLVFWVAKKGDKK